MLFLIKYFFKRLPREGFKSLSVPALALTLVYLINVLGGILTRMEAEYEWVMEHLPIIIEVSDGDGAATDGLEIGDGYVRQFLEPDAFWSLHGYVDNVLMKRTLDILDETERTLDVVMTSLSSEGLMEFFFPARNSRRESANRRNK
jgi:hypothetical protein